ncbi:MAG: hypothetical protein JWO62_2675 [Acidimicrobiaceae bacterium]|jgi:hypothetical protein|nr:hypothetical protein [Acidimicrobiaceae bacterium]
MAALDAWLDELDSAQGVPALGNGQGESAGVARHHHICADLMSEDTGTATADRNQQSSWSFGGECARSA